MDAHSETFAPVDLSFRMRVSILKSHPI